jgi:dynein heavy chain
MILVRHGLMIVGDPLAGKSSSYMVLADALADLHKEGLMDENGVRFCPHYLLFGIYRFY